MAPKKAKNFCRPLVQHIRGVLAQGYEWADMPQRPGDTEDARSRRGPYYATIKRINQNKDFFERVWHVQPRCMAVFGRKVETTFLKLHQARRNIEVSAQMLAERVSDPSEPGDESTRKLYEQMCRDIWDHGNFEPEKDKVGKLLTEFTQETEAFAKPIIEGLYRSSWSRGSWKMWMILSKTRKFPYLRFGKSSTNSQ
jgi:hypothetical protein